MLGVIFGFTNLVCLQALSLTRGLPSEPHKWLAEVKVPSSCLYMSLSHCSIVGQLVKLLHVLVRLTCCRSRIKTVKLHFHVLVSVIDKYQMNRVVQIEMDLHCFYSSTVLY